MQKIVLVTAGLVSIAIAAAAFWFSLPGSNQPQSLATVNVDGAEIVGPFVLTRQDGVRVTSDELIDGPTLIYFGYTSCPDVCPVDVQLMAMATDLLAERGIEVTPVFITIDPARDTPGVMRNFVEAMHPSMIGLTGSEEDIRKAADAYKVYYAKVETEGSDDDFLMNHAAFTYFMLPDGIAALFRRGFPAEEIADEIERVLRARGLTG